MTRNIPDKYFIFLIAFLVSLTPFAVDTYLVTMPVMAKYFNTNLHNIELTVSIFLVGYSVGQFVGGPLSDNFGRKYMALVGLFIFIFSSFMIFSSTNIVELWVFRFTQAFGGGFALVNGASSIRDRFSGEQSAKVFSTLTLIMSIPPLVAPIVGSFIGDFLGWEYIFWFLGCYGCLVFLMVVLFLPNGSKRPAQNFLLVYKEILTHKIAIRYILVMAFCFSGLFIFIAKASFIYIDFFEIENSLFAYFFGANVLVMMLLNRLNFILLKIFPAKRLLLSGVAFQLLCGVCLVVASQNGPTLGVVVLFLALYIGSLGLIFGNSMALALEFFPHCGGSATAVIGITEFLLSGVVGAIVMQITSDTLTPFFVSMSVVSLASLLILVSYDQLSSRFAIKDLA